MGFLAIDSATEFCSVALSIGEGEQQQVFSRGEELPRQHSQALLPFVNEVLHEAGVTLKELDAIIVSQGPGSFTGVRIGASIAQGLAFSQNLPLVQVSTLAAMAQACYRRHGANQVVAAIDARMGEVYFGTYQLEQGLMCIQGEEMVAAPDKVLIPAQLSFVDTVLTCGTGWETYPSELRHALSTQGVEHLRSSDVRLPHALDMLSLGIAAFTASGGISALDLSPNYLRNEVTWQKLPGR